MHIEVIETRTFRICIPVYPIFINEWLGANIKFTLHKALIRSRMTYACTAWEFVADTNLLKL
jgi:hypothetical protein